ncbi:MAG: hypothetical protein E6Q24_13575 [Chitinophagaceae bacterium]|jgi:signal transduction histidine kinase|nr:hypothetical protein [Sphingobacteriales bacterium]OJW05064.1 MAG: hypothetical protein BGO52_21530 [Sphingobacteriales bacterium 44-61]TXJ25913.1 MAG: hypothetical protein E6Q24_13575 [Chitinophagaceae bacterium]
MNSSSGEIYFFIVVGNAILIGLIGFILYFVFQYRRRKAESIRESQRLEEKFRQTLLQTQLEIQEQTLKTISQEIHDNIGQALTLAKLNLNTMLPVVDEQLQQKILNSKELVSKAIGDLRDLSHSLDTDYVQEMGLQRAIEYEMEMIQKAGTMKAIFQVQGSPYRLNKQKELILFRIVQEAFNNIIKHADAKTLKAAMTYFPDALKLEVSDDGKGVDLSPLNETAANFGLGIRNMHKRAQLIGAEFNMNSTLQAGTAITIFLPVETNTDDSKQ